MMRCSFCKDDLKKVEAMVSGPNVFICAKCVEVAMEELEKWRNLGQFWSDKQPREDDRFGEEFEV